MCGAGGVGTAAGKPAVAAAPAAADVGADAAAAAAGPGSPPTATPGGPLFCTLINEQQPDTYFCVTLMPVLGLINLF